MTDDTDRRPNNHNAEPAPIEWTETTARFVRALASTGQPFTTDEVWHMLDEHCPVKAPNPKAMGGLMLRMRNREHVIVPMFTYYATIRPQSHSAPKQCWLGVPSWPSELPKPTDQEMEWAHAAIRSVGAARARRDAARRGAG